MFRNEWLAENSAKESDVMIDSEGSEYILVEPTLMDDGDEPEDGRMKKVFLSKDLKDEE